MDLEKGCLPPITGSPPKESLGEIVQSIPLSSTPPYLFPSIRRVEAESALAENVRLQIFLIPVLMLLAEPQALKSLLFGEKVLSF